MVSTDTARQFILIDLGLAFKAGGTNFTLDSRTIPGTLYYYPPEFLRPNFRQTLNYRSDLYMIGLTVYEYASGNNPFLNIHVSYLETMKKIARFVPPPLHSLRPDLDFQFCSIIDQLLKKMPALRPANIPRMIQELEVYK